MKTTIDIDINNARSVLYISSGSFEQSEIIKNMTDEEIKDEVLKHCKCWGISEVKE